MTLGRRLSAEFIGTAILTATVIGSGVMAQDLAQGNDAVALLANTGATMAALAVLIALFAPVSGAHFNPVLTITLAVLRRHGRGETTAYVCVQFGGAIAGTLLAHAMFGMPLLEAATRIRTGPAIWLSEIVATGGLLLIILGHRHARDAVWMVPAWIGAAYWFTASTSFANPAISVGRSLSNSFAGIRPSDVPAFIAAQFIGAAGAVVLARWLYPGAAPARS